MRFEAAILLAGASLAAAQVPVWGQCGGINHNGGTTCASGSSCVSYNPYYSQCIPGAQVPNPQPTSTPQPTTTSTTPPVISTPTNTPTPTQPGGSGPNPSASAGPSGLHAKIWAKGGRYYGTACDQNTLGISQIAQIVRDEFGVLTPENSMKWESTEGSRGSFSLTGGDYLVNWAQQNGKLVRGHTLVWHSQLPTWVQNINDRTTLTTVMENHINTVMGRWKGKIFHWDVVNEVFEDNGTYRNSVFYRLLGEEFIALSFRIAARVDPACKLYINDYNLDYTSAKLTNFVALANKLKNAGVPIHGVGTQAHLIVGNGAIPSFAGPLNSLASTGLDVAITELDIRMTLPSTAAKVTQQNNDFKSVHAACLAQSKCVGITVWGIDDGHSWIPGTFPGTGDGLLWNSSYQKKSAYTAVVQALA